MSDLQCAATVVVLGAGTTATALVGLRERRAALVYDTGTGTTTAATDLADALGVPQRPALEGPTAGSPHGAWVDDVLEELADEHRGECVVLVLDDDAMAGLAGRSGHDPAAGLVIDIDDDGRRVGQ